MQVPQNVKDIVFKITDSAARSMTGHVAGLRVSLDHRTMGELLAAYTTEQMNDETGWFRKYQTWENQKESFQGLSDSTASAMAPLEAILNVINQPSEDGKIVVNNVLDAISQYGYAHQYGNAIFSPKCPAVRLMVDGKNAILGHKPFFQSTEAGSINDIVWRAVFDAATKSYAINSDTGNDMAVDYARANQCASALNQDVVGDVAERYGNGLAGKVFIKQLAQAAKEDGGSAKVNVMAHAFVQDAVVQKVTAREARYGRNPAESGFDGYLDSVAQAAYTNNLNSNAAAHACIDRAADVIYAPIRFDNRVGFSYDSLKKYLPPQGGLSPNISKPLR